jgi:TRAP transporter TAXI family solute receptor
MSRSRFILISLSVLVCVGGAIAVWRSCAGPGSSQEQSRRIRACASPSALCITSGTPGGTYIRVGELLARALGEFSELEAEATPSNGTIQNIHRLLKGEADLALAVGQVVASHPRRAEMSTILPLYTDRLQVVVRRSASIEDLSDLEGKRVLTGPDESGTMLTATQILTRVFNLHEELDYTRVPAQSFSEMSSELRANNADAAFFLASAPAIAVAEALRKHPGEESHCCELLDLEDHVEAMRNALPHLEESKIHGLTYENQPNRVNTVGTRALLISRKDLENEVVREVLSTFFDNIGDLAVAAPGIGETRIERTLDEVSSIGADLHPGVDEFNREEEQKLLIATGSLNGKYYDIGKRMQLLIEQSGFPVIPARAIHTEGSLENLELLIANERPTLAILQYDTTLASLWSEIIYGDRELAEILDVPDAGGLKLRRIAVLHDEVVHVLMNRDRIPARARRRPTLQVLKHAKKPVCLGPRNSGTQNLSRALLYYHGIELEPERMVFLSVPDMLVRLRGGEIDAGFFVSHLPSQALKTIVHDDQLRLLHIDNRRISGLLGSALYASKIEAGTYGAQRDDEGQYPPVDTIGTRAVLVAREDLPDAERITRAIYEGDAFLGIRGGAKAMAEDLRGVPWHPAARAYCQEALPELCPRDKGFPWAELLGILWRALAILVILAGGYQGFVKFWRDRKRDDIAKRVLAISLEASEPDTVNDLLKIRDEELLKAVGQGNGVRKRWWPPAELDMARWRYLHDLINGRVKQAKENLTSALAEDLRRIAEQEDLDDATRRDRLHLLEERVWRYFQSGELDASHESILLQVIQENLGHRQE